MKEKLTLQDLVDLLAKQTSLTKKEADAFFREIFAIIAENVFNEDVVKIKDFGTFKLTLVNSRESVNVNTGAKIEIPAHYKLSFLPDRVLKELVNKPFSHFETTLLEEGVTFDISERNDEADDEIEADEESAKDENVADEIVSASENKKTPSFSDQLAKALQKSTDEIEQVVEPAKDIPVKEEMKEEPKNEKQEEEDKKPEVVTPSAATPLSTGLPSYSYVYTYSTPESSTPENESITMTVSSPIVEETKILNSSEPKEEKKTLSPLNLKDEIEELEDSLLAAEIPLEINKVQEKIDQLKDAIDALTKVNFQSEILATQDSEIEAEQQKSALSNLEDDEEDATIDEELEELDELDLGNSKFFEENQGVPMEEIPQEEEVTVDEVVTDLEDDTDDLVSEELEEEVLEETVETETVIEAETIVEDVMPAVSEDVEVDIEDRIKQIESSLDELKELEKQVLSDDVESQEGTNSNIVESIDEEVLEGDDLDEPILDEIESDENNIVEEGDEDAKKDDSDDDPIDEELYDYNYYHESSLSRIRRRLPIIILLIAATAFGIYKFVQLFNQKNHQEFYSGQRGGLLNDTISYEHALMADSLARLDSIASSSVNALASQTPAARATIAPQTTDDLIEQLEQEVASVGQTSEYDRVVSPRLKIVNVRKAEIRRQFLAGKGSQNVSTEAAPSVESSATSATSSLPTKIQVKAGASLRSLAREYYGHDVFWVYIFKENEALLKSPDNLSLGVQLVIPDLKKYNVNATNEAEMAKAKTLESGIMSGSRN